MTRKKPPLFVVDPTKPNRADQFIKEAAETEAMRFLEGYDGLKARCESPIEELLMAALYAGAQISEYNIHFMLTSTPPAEPYFDRAAFVYQQVTVGNYRVDILVVDATIPTDQKKPRWMVVECDGHDFHERTKEQARRDKQRDRFFQSIGCKVLRFTGSEIWAKPEECADEVFDELAANDEWRNRPR